LYVIYISNIKYSYEWNIYMNNYFRVRCCQSPPAERIHGDHHRPHVRYLRWTIQIIQVEEGRSAVCRVYMFEYLCIHVFLAIYVFHIFIQEIWVLNYFCSVLFYIQEHTYINIYWQIFFWIGNLVAQHYYWNRSDCN
jgi:hypothetical protein